MAKSVPLIISPALPPGPAKIVEKVKKMGCSWTSEFLADNVLLVQHLQELSQAGTQLTSMPHALASSSCLCEISDLLTWASCFLAFMATNLEQHDVRNLAAYGIIILQLAQRHGGSRWLLYDCQFRQHKVAGASLPWADINPSLMVAIVLGQANNGYGHCCPLCLSSNHSREDCALLSMEQPKPRPPFNYSGLPLGCLTRCSAPYQSVDPSICHRFNCG